VLHAGAFEVVFLMRFTLTAATSL